MDVFKLAAQDSMPNGAAQLADDGLHVDDGVLSSADLAWLRTRLVRRARSVGLDVCDVDDALQETCIVIWRKRVGAVGRAWLFAVAWNRCRDASRRRCARQEIALVAEDARASAPGPLAALSDDSEPRRVRVHGAVLQLDPFRREIVRMRFFEGLTVLEIARRRCASRKKIRWALESALVRIRSTLSS